MTMKTTMHSFLFPLILFTYRYHASVIGITIIIDPENICLSLLKRMDKNIGLGNAHHNIYVSPSIVTIGEISHKVLSLLQRA